MKFIFKYKFWIISSVISITFILLSFILAPKENTIPVKLFLDTLNEIDVKNISHRKIDYVTGESWCRASYYITTDKDKLKLVCNLQPTNEILAQLRALGFIESTHASLFKTFLVLLPSLILLLLLVIALSGHGIKGLNINTWKKGSIKERFTDIAGCDSALEEVREIVDYLKNNKKYKDVGAKIPKGVLLVGPPGTGKTLIAKAIAGEAELTESSFVSLSGSDFVELYVGLGAKRVRSLFERARKYQKSIIFIDEIDAVGQKRNGIGNNSERDQTLNALLVEMDGMTKNSNIIVIAATNRVDTLDEALLRPGRFDRQIHIELPDVTGREEILKIHTKNVKVTDDVDLASVAKATTGMSGAELANVVNEAALLSIKHGTFVVNNQLLLEARDRILFGNEKRKVLDKGELERVAVHEAGHALAHILLKDPVLELHKVTIIPRGSSLGSTQFLLGKDSCNYTEKQLYNKLVVLLAGRVAEELILKDRSIGAEQDITQASNIARNMVCRWGLSNLGITYRHIEKDDMKRDTVENAIESIVNSAYDNCQVLLSKQTESIKKISEALLINETLTAEEVNTLINECKIRS